MLAILNAIRQGNRNLAFALIQHALPYQVSQADNNGQTPLHLAVQKNFLEIVKALLEKGANINAVARDQIYRQMTPLHYAAMTGNLKVVKILMAWGANLYLTNEQGHMPSRMAALHGFQEISRFITLHEHQPPQYQWPNLSPGTPAYKNLEHSLSRKLLELRNSSIEAMEARSWLNQHSKKSDNVVNLMEFRKKKMR